MPERPLYSDRETGGRARTLEEIPLPTWVGLAALIERKIDSHWLAGEFPEYCQDGNGAVGTNFRDVYDSIAGTIPALEFPLDRETAPELFDILDLIDYIAQYIAKPEQVDWHQFFKHWHLKFDEEQGAADFQREVNELFARGGIAFELDDHLKMRRLGPTEAREIVPQLKAHSGDPTLDTLIEEARTLFFHIDSKDRRHALERLWDAFERFKTIEPGRDKKAQVDALLARIVSAKWRETLSNEAKELTRIGNTFSIRHHETGQEQLSDEMIDYLFVRCASWIVHLLGATARLDRS